MSRKFSITIIGIALSLSSLSTFAETMETLPLALLVVPSVDCELPAKLDLNLSKEKVNERENQLIKLEKETRWYSYWASHTKLILSAKDDEDKATFNDERTSIKFVEDNQGEFAQLKFEIPLNKLFAFKSNSESKIQELKAKQASEKSDYLTKLADKYLAFKDATEEIDSIKPITLVTEFSDTRKQLIALRKAATLYYLYAEPEGNCKDLWLQSYFES